MINPFRKHMRIIERYNKLDYREIVVQTWYPWWPFAWWNDAIYYNIEAFELAKNRANFEYSKMEKQVKIKRKKPKTLWKDGITL